MSGSEDLAKLLAGGPRPLKLGSSFKKRSSGHVSNFHTMRADFKPASVDQSQSGAVEIANDNNVSVSLPNVQGCASSHSVFKGHQKPHNKECVLIVDHKTGEVTLERLGDNVQLKIINRPVSNKKPSRPHSPTMADFKSMAKHQKSHSSHKPPKSSSEKGETESRRREKVPHHAVVSNSSSSSSSTSSASSSSDSEPETSEHHKAKQKEAALMGPSKLRLHEELQLSDSSSSDSD